MKAGFTRLTVLQHSVCFRLRPTSLFLPASSVFLTLLCCDRFHKGFSLSFLVCPSLSMSQFASLCRCCHSILTSPWWLCSISPIPTVFLQVSPHFHPFLSFHQPNVIEVVQAAVSVPIDSFLLSMFIFFSHQRNAAKKKAVHFNPAGDEHLVSVNLELHFISSSHALCSSLQFFIKY